MARTLTDIRNVELTIKAITTSFITGLTLLIPMLFGFWLINVQNLMGAGRFVQILSSLAGLWLWGYYANKFWGFK